MVLGPQRPLSWGFLHQCFLPGGGPTPFLLINCSVMSDSLRPHGLQHARLPCPSPSPGVYSNSCPLSQWCHPAISSSVIPFSSRLQSFPASGSFPISQLFVSGGQSFGASALVLPMNIQDGFPLGGTGLILLSKGFSRVFSSTTSSRGAFGNSREAFLALDHVVGTGTRGGAGRQKLDRAQDGGTQQKMVLLGCLPVRNTQNSRSSLGTPVTSGQTTFRSLSAKPMPRLDCRVLLVAALGSEKLRNGWLYSSVFQGLVPPQN